MFQPDRLQTYVYDLVDEFMDTAELHMFYDEKEIEMLREALFEKFMDKLMDLMNGKY